MTTLDFTLRNGETVRVSFSDGTRADRAVELIRDAGGVWITDGRFAPWDSVVEVRLVAGAPAKIDDYVARVI